MVQAGQRLLEWKGHVWRRGELRAGWLSMRELWENKQAPEVVVS